MTAPFNAAFFSEAYGALRHIILLQNVGWRVKFSACFVKLVTVAAYCVAKWCRVHKLAWFGNTASRPASCPDPLHGHCEATTDACEHDHAVLRALDFCRDGFDGCAPDCGDSSNGVAVIVPVLLKRKQDASKLINLLHALDLQTVPPQMLLLVDDGSRLPLRRVFSSQTLRDRLPARMLAKIWLLRLDKNRGPAAARNAGLHEAVRRDVRVVCFTDVDCQPYPTWVQTMVQAQQKMPGVVAGMTYATKPHTLVGHYHDLCGTLNGRLCADGTLLYGCTCNLSISLSHVHLGFDEDFTQAAYEDIEFCVRARKAGVNLTFQPDAKTLHDYDTSILDVFWQFARYGHSEPIMHVKHPEYHEWLAASTEISNVVPLQPTTGSSADM